MPVHGFRFYFTPLTGVLFAFPSRYSFAIGSSLVFSLGSWSTRIRTGFLVPRPTQVPHHGAALCFAYGALTRSGAPFQALPLHARFISPRVIPMRPYNPGQFRFGLLRVRSPLLAESLLISSPRLLRWFTSPGVAPPHYFIHARGAWLTPCGLPHSGTPGSKDVCSSPGLFAACRALPRHTAPQASAMDLYFAWPYCSSARPATPAEPRARQASSRPGAWPLALRRALYAFLCFPSLVMSKIPRARARLFTGTE